MTASSDNSTDNPTSNSTDNPIGNSTNNPPKNQTENQWHDWYASFDDTHGSEQRQDWYSQAATAYRWARPKYPQDLVDKVFTQAGLSPQSSLLEIGCGPGIATAAFAEKGLSIVAIEPSPVACGLAHQGCRNNSKVMIINSTFENYELAPQSFDAVLAATSFHWIAPEIACQKSAAALKPGGALILLWATPPQPSEEICQYLRPIYEHYCLDKLGEEQCRTEDYYRDNFELFAAIVNQSGYFQASAEQTAVNQNAVAMEKHETLYSIEKYLALLSTLSPYIALEESVQNDLLADLGDRLAEELETGALHLTHWFASQVAPLKTS
jgi:SAM-dependent methyltransferase